MTCTKQEGPTFKCPRSLCQYLLQAPGNSPPDAGNSSQLFSSGFSDVSRVLGYQLNKEKARHGERGSGEPGLCMVARAGFAAISYVGCWSPSQPKYICRHMWRQIHNYPLRISYVLKTCCSGQIGFLCIYINSTCNIDELVAHTTVCRPPSTFACNGCIISRMFSDRI